MRWHCKNTVGTSMALWQRICIDVQLLIRQQCKVYLVHAADDCYPVGGLGPLGGGEARGVGCLGPFVGGVARRGVGDHAKAQRA